MIDQALSYYFFLNPHYTFLRHNENMTYQVIDGENKYLLRIHKAAEGLNFTFQCGETPRDLWIQSEIELLNRLITDTELLVQHPIPNRFGEYITKLPSGDCVTVLSWFDGEDYSKMDLSNESIYQIGVRIGSLHNQLSKFPYIARYSYDEKMVDRVLKELRLALKQEDITAQHYECIQTFLFAFQKFCKEEKKNFILIHADLSKSNLICHGEHIVPIDFSLSGYALPEMDLADMSCSLNNKELTNSMLDGYRSVSEYQPKELYIDVYFAFSIVMYIAYHHGKFRGDEKSQNSLDRWTTTIIGPVLTKMK